MQRTSSPDAQSSLAPGTLVAGRYRIERELGRGGMATVYLARDERHDAPVAIKVLRPELASLVSSERFAREIRITARLQHPHVLPVLDSGSADGIPFYTMPFVAGETLGDRLSRERQLPIADAVRIARQIADALAYAHAQGFVHRDIKPSNVLLAGYPSKAGSTSDWYAMLADFGIARAMDSTVGDRITDSGLAVGTAMYMSPEQSSGDEVDGRSDIYALGCVLYEMLAGTPPFNGPTPQAILARHAVDAVPSLRTVRATVSPALDAVIATALSKVPADRYADAGAMRDALVAAGDATTYTTAMVPHARRRRAVLALGGLALVAAAGAAWLTLGRVPALDANRVMVFPLDGAPAGTTTGEDVATMVGNALDGVGGLRWIDGWRAMDAASRAGGHDVDVGQARRIARAARCGHFVLGRIVPLGTDSVSVRLELWDAGANADEPVTTGSAPGPRAEPWRPGLTAVNLVLPKLLGSGAARVDSEWTRRDPGAVAQFLLGEAAFRRLSATDALPHYRDAVARDSTFVIAAMRGAQAAGWLHQEGDAEPFVRLALRQQLSERYRHFALGDLAYIEGRADSAAHELRRAIAADPEMSVAWTQLAETYVHLLPARGRVDSLAVAALERAHALDPAAGGIALHLVEQRLRDGRVDDADALAARVRALDPDSALATRLDVMLGCARHGARSVKWRDATRRFPLAVLAAGVALGEERDAACAESAFASILQDYPRDSADASSYRWPALIGLQSVLLARGDTAGARARLDRAIADTLGGRTLYLLDATLVPALSRRAAAIADSDIATYGSTGYAGAPANRLWHLATWAASQRPATARSFADALSARAARGSATDSLDARSAAAHVAMADARTGADSVAAIERLSALLDEPVTVAQASWDLIGSHAADRLLLAQALLARGDARGAMDVANVFDSMSQLPHLLYLPASLTLRVRAAHALHDETLATRLQNRLSALGRAR